MKKMLQMVAALAVLVVMASCSSGPKDPFCGLLGNWTPEKVAGTEKVVFDVRQPEVEFTADGKARGYTGLNSFNGNFKIDSEKGITFGPFASTMKGGTPAVMAFERSFNTALNATKTFEVSGDTLYLYGPDKSELMVLKSKPVQPKR